MLQSFSLHYLHHDTLVVRQLPGVQSGFLTLYSTIMALPTTKAHTVLTRQQYRLNNAYMRRMRNGAWLALLFFIIISTSYYLVCLRFVHSVILGLLELTTSDHTEQHLVANRSRVSSSETLGRRLACWGEETSHPSSRQHPRCQPMQSSCQCCSIGLPSSSDSELER